MITISSLSIVDNAGRRILDDLSLSIKPGERVGIVGESGSGKTTLALSLLGAIRPGLRVAGGRIEVDGADVLALRPQELRQLRGRTVSYLPQDPATALTPTMRVCRQISELSGDPSVEDIGRRLTDVGLPGDERFQRRYPHQLSGGQQQRLALARSTAGDPKLLILDEPTTGLDALAQNRVLEQIEHLAGTREMTLLFITHDLAAATRMSDRLVVLHHGVIAEEGPLAAVLERPSAAYTQDLLLAVPTIAEAALRTITPPPPGRPTIQVTDLRASYRDGRARNNVVKGVSFSVSEGECVALLGLSGSGKSTIARCLAGTHERDSGQVLLDGEPLESRVRRRSVQQRRRIQVIPQDSAGSLNPRRSVGAAIARPLMLLQGLSSAAASAETARLLSLVGLPAELAARYPRQLSGGQRQRVTIARALAAGPEVLICDEMTSSLDVRVQASVLELVTRLRRDLGLAVVLITHDLGVMARVADRVLVLREGLVLEEGRVDEVLQSPQHDWTRALIAAATASAHAPAPAPALPRQRTAPALLG